MGKVLTTSAAIIGTSVAIMLAILAVAGWVSIGIDIGKACMGHPDAERPIHDAAIETVGMSDYIGTPGDSLDSGSVVIHAYHDNGMASLVEHVNASEDGTYIYHSSTGRPVAMAIKSDSGRVLWDCIAIGDTVTREIVEGYMGNQYAGMHTDIDMESMLTSYSTRISKYPEACE